MLISTKINTLNEIEYTNNYIIYKEYLYTCKHIKSKYYLYSVPKKTQCLNNIYTLYLKNQDI